MLQQSLVTLQLGQTSTARLSANKMTKRDHHSESTRVFSSILILSNDNSFQTTESCMSQCYGSKQVCKRGQATASKGNHVTKMDLK